MNSTPTAIVAVDIGNSQIKLGLFPQLSETSAQQLSAALPKPHATLELPLIQQAGEFDSARLAHWCDAVVPVDARWSIGSVHRDGTVRLTEALATWTKQRRTNWRIRKLTHRDLPLRIRVEEPGRVGVDRLLAAVAANRLRTVDRPAITIDLGTALTVDLVDTDGSFAGGAILPGIALAGRALAEQTDALPHVTFNYDEPPPRPLGTSTRTAIQAGLYWGAIGAIGELVSRLSTLDQAPPDVFVTGGAGQFVFPFISQSFAARFEPHLVLAGIVVAELQSSPSP